MKPASLPATLLLTALALAPLTPRAAPGGAETSAAPEKPLTLAQVSRALTTIDDAGRPGALPDQRARWQVASAASPADPGPRTLAAYALVHGVDAWAELKRLTDQFPGSAIPWVAMWRIYLEWGVLDQIDRSLPVARQAERGNWLIDLTEAMVAERRGQQARAMAGYRAALARDPENVDAQVGVARLGQAAGDEVTARLAADTALKILPTHAPALAVLAGLAEARGDAAGAAALLQRVAAASARDRDTRIKLARLLRQQGDMAGSLEQWKAVLALREDAETLVALAEAGRLASDPATEQRALERLTALDPGSAEWRRIAEIRLQALDPAGAERALRQAMARDPKDPQTQLALGRLLAGWGRVGEGLGYLRAAGPPAAADREAAEARINLRRLTTPDVAALQAAGGALIDATYRQRLKELPALSGTVTIRVTTDGSGRATLVEPIEDTLHDDDVQACAYWNLKDAAYPTQKPGRHSFSFTLRPGR
jgi:tetratricopeptide (TPR) repeat protein